MVGVGPKGRKSALARVSLVDYDGNTLYDKLHFPYVKPEERVTDWRTFVSGVTPAHMKNAITLEQARRDVQALIRGKRLVGHALHHDLEVLQLTHPARDIRDTAMFSEYRPHGRPRALRVLAAEHLNMRIQHGQHCSIQDAQAAMLLYRRAQSRWDDSMVAVRGRFGPSPSSHAVLPVPADVTVAAAAAAAATTSAPAAGIRVAAAVVAASAASGTVRHDRLAVTSTAVRDRSHSKSLDRGRHSHSLRTDYSAVRHHVGKPHFHR